jgi:predicted nucleotidyltransferase
MRVIRRFARQVAEHFRPDKIVLFGSHAYGIPHADSDVDILVIMPTRNQIDQAFKIRCDVPACFPMDLIVLKPRNVKWRLEEHESFLTEIMTKGKILYEKNYPRMDTQGTWIMSVVSGSGKKLTRSRAYSYSQTIKSCRKVLLAARMQRDNIQCDLSKHGWARQAVTADARGVGMQFGW